MRSIRRSAALLAVAGLSLPALAQQASFSHFGNGCPGTGSGTVCKSANGNANTLQNLFFARTSEVAIEVPNGINSPLVAGFEILTKARFGKTTLKAHVYVADSAGAPQASPAATGDMIVDTQVAWYSVSFAKPLLVKPGQKFFLSWTDTRVPFSLNVEWPVPTTGAKATSYHREANSGPWTRGPFQLHPWAWRVLCPGGSVQPVLTNSGLPKLGQSYTVQLVKAKPASATLLITGLSNTKWGPIQLPFDLQPLGAAGCSLLASFDLASVLPTDSGGNAALKIPVPNDSNLTGAKLHHQWAIVDTGANSLGLAFTGGGTATLGN